VKRSSSASAVAAAGAAPARARVTLSPGGFGLLVFVALLVVYGPALGGAMLWDDAGHVTRADLRSLAGLARIWFEIGATQQYYPLVHSAFWLEHRLWSDATVGYHVLNVAWHALAAGLFLAVLRRLAVPGALLAASLFAFHPVCVESVAWIAEQKNTLSLVLYLAAALTYLRYDAGRSRRDYVVATIFFVLALLTKTVTATLPAALLVVFWWKRGRLRARADVRPLLPWFALGAASGVVTAWFEHTLIGAQGTAFELGLAGRLVLAGRVVWFYLGKLLWPADLNFIYPRWTIDPATPWQWLFLAAAFALLGGLFAVRHRTRAPLAVALLFAGALFPVLGFFNVYPFIFSFVADHFQYLASLPVFALAGAGLVLGGRRLALPSPAGRGLALVLCAGLALLSWRQSRDYRDVFTLYEATIARNPGCWMAHTNLGVALVDAGRVKEALPHFHAALAERANYAEGENNLGHALNLLDRPAEALPHLERALQLHPGYAAAHNNLAIALMALGRTDEGLAAFAAAVREDPRDAETECNLGLALARADRTAEALPHFQRAVALNPRYGEAELNWAIGLMLTGRFAEARPHFERALELEPRSVDARVLYGRALAREGRADEAIGQFRAALALEPESKEAHLELARVLQQIGRTEEARHHLREAGQSGP
jgi:tetratricopeptide (TPR) repeat protein